MEETTQKENTEKDRQHICRLSVEMDDLIKSLHNLQIEMAELRKGRNIIT